MVGSTATTEISDASPRTGGSPSGRRPPTGSTTTGATALARRPAGVAAFLCGLHKVVLLPLGQRSVTTPSRTRFHSIRRAEEGSSIPICQRSRVFLRMPAAREPPVHAAFSRRHRRTPADGRDDRSIENQPRSQLQVSFRASVGSIRERYWSRPRRGQWRSTSTSTRSASWRR